MRCAIVGAGAVGGYYGAALAHAGHDVVFVARGANLEALRARGLRVTGAMGEIAVPDAAATDEVPSASDLVLLCVKNYDLEAAAHAIRSADGTVLTLQNGVDAPNLVREIVGDRVLGGATGIVADLAEPAHVHVTSAYAWIRFGEVDGSGVTERVRQVASWLEVTGIEAIPEADARIALWQKMSLMCGMAGLTTLHQRPMGEILGDPELRETFVRILNECRSVARANGIGLAADFVDERMGYAERIDPEAMSSMSRDFARGRRIELETFNGAIVRMGAEVGVAVSENQKVYDGIRAAVSS